MANNSLELKTGDIIIFKGGKWSKLLSFLYSKENRNLYLARSIISLVTLSRYVHTATIIKEKDTWYIVQSLYNDGVCKKELYLPWLLNKINENKADVYRQPNFNSKQFDKNLKNIIGMEYPLLKILNIGLFNLTGLDLLSSFQKNKFFCSETTCLLHNLEIIDANNEARLTSPADLANSDKLIKII